MKVLFIKFRSRTTHQAPQFMTSQDNPPDPATTTQETKPSEASGWLRLWRSQQENIRLVAIALILALLIRVFVAEPRYIPSDSMIPTLHTGDRLVVEKVSYWFHPARKGDIIVFNPPAQLQSMGYRQDQVFIKRIIGQPGETVSVKNGRVYVDGRSLSEDYIAEPPAYQLNSVTVPTGSYFVMGDNRNDSNDSHVWGFLPQKNIIGRAVFRFFPLDHVGFISR
jgi:signal peptidase I